MKSVNYTKELFEFYNKPQKRTDGFTTWYVEPKLKICTKRSDGGVVPEIILIDEQEIQPWQNRGHVAYTGHQGGDFNEVLDLTTVAKFSALTSS